MERRRRKVFKPNFMNRESVEYGSVGGSSVDDGNSVGGSEYVEISSSSNEEFSEADATDEELQVCLTNFNSSILNIKARNDKREEEPLAEFQFQIPWQPVKPLNQSIPLIVISPSCWDDPDDQQTPSITADSKNSSVIEIENNQSSSTQRKSDVTKKDNNFIYKYLISSVDNVKPNKINYKCFGAINRGVKSPEQNFNQETLKSIWLV